MKYRLLGKSGLRVSEAALGTMTFGDELGWGSPKAEAQKVYGIGESCWESLPPTLCVDALGGHLARR
jgi:aryl-alcohol dehydrogenase-like predicted oxidoreductase